jgi:5-methylcytosine-specific restriction endonuclease McrA
MRRRRFTLSEQEFVQERALFSCQYCKYPYYYSHDAFHFEHIISLFYGGTNDLINIAFSCDGCNSNKIFILLGLIQKQKKKFLSLTLVKKTGRIISIGTMILHKSLAKPHKDELPSIYLN